MKNTKLKNVIFTAGMAIFTGVLLLGVNAAIGAATPTVDPPGAGVSPTFTGLNVNGNIQNSAGNVSVSDNLAVTGNVTATGSVSATGNVSTSGQLTVGGTAISSDGDVLLVNDMLRVGDGLFVNGPRSRIDGDFINVNAVLRANESIINFDDPVLIDDDLIVTDDVTVNGNFTVVGAAKANRFGSYSYNLSSYVTLLPKEHDDILYTCPAGRRLISCGYFSSGDTNTNINSWTKWIVVTRIIPNTTNNRCEIWGTNTHATENKYLRAYGVCLDPDA